ncbi:transposase, partial [Moraxella lacunata]|uniref:transposase n=1 Tax=Moraxella lacunata TaxID=477 RepID=UPI001D17C6D1
YPITDSLKSVVYFAIKSTPKVSVSNFWGAVHCCGVKLDELPLSVRNWTCPNCNTNHDRDINASINILNKADKILNLS